MATDDALPLPDGEDTQPDKAPALPFTPEQMEEFMKQAERQFSLLASFMGQNQDAPGAETPAPPGTDPHLAPGALYSVRGSIEGVYQVAKVLHAEERGVHIRLYANEFSRRPTALSPELLGLGSVMPEASEDQGYPWALSVGHLPVSHDTFASFDPVFVARAEVSDDELEGYRIWRSSGGGFF
jgi:hypothetical protein